MVDESIDLANNLKIHFQLCIGFSAPEKCIYSFEFRFWMMPAILLKKMVMGNFDKGYVDSEIADSIDFMVTSVSSYSND